MPMFIARMLGALNLVLCFDRPNVQFKVPSTKHKVQLTKVEAGDPRYRLPLSQLVSPSERGGK